MKKICMIVPKRDVKGGIAAVVNGYRGSLLENKYQVSYVESYCNGGKVKKLLQAITSYIVFLCKLIFDKPDLLHIHSSFGPSFYRKMIFINLSYAFQVPIVNHIHGADFDSFYPLASEKKKRLIRKIYGKCNIFIALSEEWEKKLAQIVPISKIKVVENYSMLSDDWTEEKTDNKVLFLGTIDKRKGCYDIPAIAKEVKKEINDCEFILAGVGEVLEVNKLAELYKVNENIEFIGWVNGEKKNKLLKSSKLLLLPSYNEGMPMCILDAMGYALPIVSTNVGGIGKLVRNEVNGYLCNPGDCACMAEGIIKILKNDDLRKEMGRQSYELAHSQFSLEKHVNKLVDVYEDIISENL